MNGKCFDIGEIQAFLDGETAPALSLQIAGHAADCQNCAVMLAKAEEENSIVFSALDREYNSLVPTQRLWSKINESIEVEKSRLPFWAKFWHSLAVFTANPSMTVAAGVLIVFCMFAAIWTMRSDTATGIDDSIASNSPASTVPNRPNEVVTFTPNIAPENPLPIKANNSTEKTRNVAVKANLKENNSRPRIQNLVYRETVATPEYLPGEESYVKTIAGLKENIDGGKDSVLPPSSRVAYERNMAVVDNAISRMKAVVQKNPRNQSAKQVLYSSYQDKIDLLNSVAQREELMASIR